MKITFIGDVHGDWGALQEYLDLHWADIYLQVGDMGLRQPGVDVPSFVVDAPLFFIDGNHDNKIALENGEFALPENVYYMPRNTMLNVNGARILFFGGAPGTVNYTKQKGLNYFPETETPSPREIEWFLDQVPRADIIVTHTGPRLPFEQHISDDPITYPETIFNDVIDLLKPEAVWAFGHFHPADNQYANYLGRHFFCLKNLGGHGSKHDMYPS